MAPGRETALPLGLPVTGDSGCGRCRSPSGDRGLGSGLGLGPALPPASSTKGREGEEGPRGPTHSCYQDGVLTDPPSYQKSTQDCGQG